MFLTLRVAAWKGAIGGRNCKLGGLGNLDRPSKKLAAGVPEKPFRLEVDENNAAFLIGDNDTVGSGLDESTEDNIPIREEFLAHGDSFGRRGNSSGDYRKGATALLRTKLS
jgi:hypothetical protein